MFCFVVMFLLPHEMNVSIGKRKELEECKKSKITFCLSSLFLDQLLMVKNKNLGWDDIFIPWIIINGPYLKSKIKKNLNT